MEIVLYMGGCCGDIVSGMIDTSGISITSGRCVVLKQRSRFKRDFEFEDDKERDNYLIESSLYWRSLPSHAADYHLRNNHSYLAVLCDDYQYAIWAATRFRELHTDEVWYRMSKASGASTIEQYAQMMLDFSSWISPDAKKSINVKDIIEGRAIEKLNQLTNLDNNASIIYQQWLLDTT